MCAHRHNARLAKVRKAPTTAQPGNDMPWKQAATKSVILEFGHQIEKPFLLMTYDCMWFSHRQKLGEDVTPIKSIIIQAETNEPPCIGYPSSNQTWRRKIDSNGWEQWRKQKCRLTQDMSLVTDRTVNLLNAAFAYVLLYACISKWPYVPGTYNRIVLATLLPTINNPIRVCIGNQIWQTFTMATKAFFTCA